MLRLVLASAIPLALTPAQFGQFNSGAQGGFNTFGLPQQNAFPPGFSVAPPAPPAPPTDAQGNALPAPRRKPTAIIDQWNTEEPANTTPPPRRRLAPVEDQTARRAPTWAPDQTYVPRRTPSAVPPSDVPRRSPNSVR